VRRGTLTFNKLIVLEGYSQEANGYFQRLKLNKWELLAAMQALLIYILIRLDEGETDHNNYDSLLLATVAVGPALSPSPPPSAFLLPYLGSTDILKAMAKQLTRSDIECSTRSALRNYGLGISWKDWIFDESTRRLDFHPPY
jgi:hypothetical protein